MSEMMTINRLENQGGSPYSIGLEIPVLNSLAHSSHDKKAGSCTFKNNQQTEMKPNLANVKAINEVLKVSRPTTRIALILVHFLHSL